MTTLCFHAHTDRHSRIYSCRSPRTCSCPWPFWRKILILSFFFSTRLCSNPPWLDAPIRGMRFCVTVLTRPSTLPAVFPEVVARSSPTKTSGSTVCPRYHQGKKCNNRTNCPHFHPDFINDHGVVPDFICHKKFQGTCEYPNSCWNQRGLTFDSALRSAFNIQRASRGILRCSFEVTREAR